MINLATGPLARQVEDLVFSLLWFVRQLVRTLCIILLVLIVWLASFALMPLAAPYLIYRMIKKS